MAAGRTTKVNVGLEVDVTGTKDIDALARSMEQAAKQAGKPLDVAASVTGTKDVAGLSTALAELPDGTTHADVTAGVAGLADVDTLAGHINGLPRSTQTDVKAGVTGLGDVDTLAGHINGLPATTSAKVDAGVTGDADVHTLAQDIADLPARKDVAVSVSASSPPGKGLKDVGADIDHVKGKAGDLAVEGSAFGSQFLGSYSEGAGLFGDLAEQLSNLKRSADEAGGSVGGGGFKGMLSIAGGLGAGILGGLLIDQVLGAFSKLEESQAAVQTAVESTTQAIIDQGGFWSQTAALASVSAIESSDVFKHLISSGESYTEVMAAMTSGGESVNKVNELMAKHGESLSIRTQSEVKGLANVADASKDAAKQKYAYLKANNLLTDSQKKAEAANKGAADGMDLTGTAARHAGDNMDYATGRVETFNKTPLNDKKNKLTTDDKASPKVDTANKKPLHDKKNRLDAADHAGPVVDGVNRKPLTNKKSYLTVADLATPKVNDYNQKPLSDKTATVDADTQPAKDDIARLNGVQVTVELVPHLDPQALDAEARRNGVHVNSSAATSAGRSVSTTAAPGFHAGYSASVGVPVNITITGALDPAGVARQIRQVLTRADRRTGPLRAGGTASLRAPV